MARYNYRAKKGPAQVIEGVIEAESEAQALLKIGALELFPISITKEGSQDHGFAGISFKGAARRVKTADLAVMTRQLADLLEAGLTIVHALDILSQQTGNKRLAHIINDIRDDIRGGATFTVALNRHGEVFSPLYVSLVHSGEISGTLEAVLNRLADFLESQEEFRTKVQAALAYPVLMAIVGFATGIVLLTFVMPKVVGIFEDLGQDLPLITVFLLSVSAFIRNYWYLAVGGAIFLFFSLKQIGKSREGKAAFDTIKNKVPVLGLFLRKVDIARFARTMGTLLNNGVTILESLEIVKEIVSNEHGKRDVRAAFVKVRDGSSLAKALAGGTYFPLFVTNMIAVGEESGQLERNLLKIADSYERETDKMIKILSSLIEPLMILGMGLMVGFIVISILLPVFQISLIAK
ncbi:MAG: type II secretion system F family protein [Candidatus Omnitrophota bacterium]